MNALSSSIMSPVKNASPPVSSQSCVRYLSPLSFDCSGLDAGNRAEKAGLCRDAEDRRLGSLRDVDRILEVGAAERVVAVRDDDDHAAAGHAPQLFIRELPDSIVKRRLRTGLLYLVDRFVEQVELVGEILPQIDLVDRRS